MRKALGFIFVLMLLAFPAWAQQPGGSGSCLGCHGDPNLSTTRDGKRVPLSVDLKRYSHSVHGSFSCTVCHPGNPHAPKEIPAELKGTPQAALIQKLDRPNPVAQLSCANCHTKEFADYRPSIHGQSALFGGKDAPLCSDCHGNHYIRRVYAPESSVRPQNVPATCGTCHSNQRLMAQYNINTRTVQTYSQSFHGRRLALGSQRVAECSSCHGFHGIYPPNDPRSSVYPANRPKTCGKPGCHPGASPRFAAGFSHQIPSPTVQPVAFWVGNLYNVIILATAGGMLLWVLMDLYRRFRSGGHQWHAPHLKELPVPANMPIKRWDIHQRLQHLMLLISFTLLVLTGVPMLFPLSPVSRLLIGAAGGPEMAGRIHRSMASLLVLGAIYHIIYLAVLFMRGKRFSAMIPNLQDMRDALQMVRYYLGLSSEPPKSGRYTLDEKVEYWSMIWGTVVMVVTGLVLWFPLAPARILGAWAVDLSRIIHGYEAVLAALAIIIWHFYHAHLNPDVFPMNKTWLTGHITAEEEARHHPLEFQEMLDKGELKPPSQKNKGK